MFQAAPTAVILGYLVIAVVGAMIAILSGVLLATVLKVGVHGAPVVKDAFLGATGSVITTIACATIPWPRNTVTTTLESGLRVETTMNRFQHPYIAAITVAIVVAALHQLIRFKHGRAGSPLR